MKIEAIDPIRATDDDGRDLHIEPGEIRIVGDNFGKLACGRGWARDVDGVVPTGEKSNQPITVLPKNLVQQNKVKGA